MKLKLDFDIPRATHLLSIRKPVLLFGSCFAERMAERLGAVLFQVAANPDGILYNPLSLFDSITRTASPFLVDAYRLFEFEGIWHSWDAHSRVSGTTREALTDNLKQAHAESHSLLHASDTVVITFGNAWVYQLKETGQVVANCHKVPQVRFEKRLLQVDEIVTAFEKLIAHPQLAGKKFLLTVSPVRYVKDGLIENNRSKATLIKATEVLVETYPHVSYFPAYEVVIDELRDHRFYEPDLVHPNALAIDYVFERFCQTQLDQETREAIREVEALQRTLAHRPFNPDDPRHQTLVASARKQLETLKTRLGLPR